VNIDNTTALYFIMQDDIFLLNTEKNLYNKKAATAEAVAVIAETEEKAPVAVDTQVEEKAAVDTPVQENIKYKGSTTSGYVILVHYPGLEFMHDAHLTALENTFRRKGIEPGNVAIVNMAAHDGIAFEPIAAQLQPRKLLIMGKNAMPPAIAPVKFNQLSQLAECTVLHTFSFDEMMDSNENKKLFWEQMKLL
jgi:hypothetical protein